MLSCDPGGLPQKITACALKINQLEVRVRVFVCPLEKKRFGIPFQTIYKVRAPTKDKDTMCNKYGPISTSSTTTSILVQQALSVLRQA